MIHMVWFSSLTRKAWTASRARFFIRQKEKPRLETRRWNHVRDIMQIGVGTADIFLEMIMQPFLGFVCIVPGSYNLVIV